MQTPNQNTLANQWTQQEPPINLKVDGKELVEGHAVVIDMSVEDGKVQEIDVDTRQELVKVHHQLVTSELVLATPTGELITPKNLEVKGDTILLNGLCIGNLVDGKIILNNLGQDMIRSYKLDAIEKDIKKKAVKASLAKQAKLHQRIKMARISRKRNRT